MDDQPSTGNDAHRYRIAGWLVAARWPLLLLGALLAGLSIVPARSLDFDRSIENMFAADDPLLVPFRQLKRTFGGNEIVLAVYTDPDLLNSDGSGIERLKRHGTRLKQTPGVRDVLSLAELDQAVRSLTALTGEQRIFDADSKLAARFLQMFEGYTHGADRRTVAVVCMLIPENETTVPRRETIDRLRAITAELPDGQITGEPAMLVDGFRYIEVDGQRLGYASTILLSLTIIICFRSLRWVVIPIAIVQLTLLLTQATLVLTGLRLSMVSSMLTAIVTVVGVATVVHIIVRYREARREGHSPELSLAESVTLLAGPVLWSCVTDAVGFISLMVAHVGPIQDFGVMMAIGSLLVLAAVLLVLPGLTLIGRVNRDPSFLDFLAFMKTSGLTLIVLFDNDPRRAWGEKMLDMELHRIIRGIERRPWTVAAVSLLIFGVTAAGVAWLEVESDFTKNFRADSPIVQAYDLVEDRLGGAGVLDVLLPAPATLNRDYLARVDRLQKRLRNEVHTAGADGRTEPSLKVLSMADAVQAGIANMGMLGRFLPAETKTRTVIAGMKVQMPVFMAALHGEDPDQPGRFSYRIMLRAVERQPSEQKRRLIQQVSQISREEFPEAEVTGFFVLLTHLIDSVLRDQWRTFAVAGVGIWLTCVIAFRGLLQPTIALVPNAFPIFMVTGLMGWMDLKINMGAAMIAAVSMGLSVDSSIHYLTSFNRARRAGLSVHEALNEVEGSVGRAMVFSTLALFVGFTVLCFSDFVPTIYFGALVSLTMLGGLLGNLVVLPLLLSLLSRRER